MTKLLNKALLKEYLIQLPNFFDMLVEVDFANDKLRCITHSEEFCGVKDEPQDFLEIIENKIHPEDQKLLLSLNSNKAYIDGLLNNQRSEFEFRVKNSKGNYVWVRGVLNACQDSDDKKALLYIINIDGFKKNELLQQDVLDKYVYKLCDFLMLINLNDNSYKMIDNILLHNSPMPPSESSDFVSAMAGYVDCYLAPMDQINAKNALAIDVIREKLEESSEYVIVYGVIDPKRGYTRKSLRFSYYNKEESIVFAFRVDITSEYLQQQKQTEDLKNALTRAQTDILTGVYNVAVKDLVKKRLKGREKQACIVFIDLDNFKEINDTYSHAKGDSLLISVGFFLQHNLRPGDLVGRVGGDEFLLFLDDVTDLDELYKKIKILNKELTTYLESEMEGINVTCSMGVSVYPKDSVFSEELIKQADAAAYSAKRLGKNRVVMYGDIV